MRTVVLGLVLLAFLAGCLVGTAAVLVPRPIYTVDRSCVTTHPTYTHGATHAQPTRRT